jgi:UDP-GlcNAc:undecaprenyl-phosphate/decaprenyl-phosphate GlcNAc-1-phosphate transferase
MLLYYSIVFFAAIALVNLSIHHIIFVAHKKHLFDEPLEERKIHLQNTPNLGGVAIFASFIFLSLLLIKEINVTELRLILAAGIILFGIGVFDDLIGIRAVHKLFFQIIVATLAITVGGVRITHLHGLFGIYQLHYFFQFTITFVFIVFLINAFNLIDGINCLAGALGVFICSCFSYFFWSLHQTWPLVLSILMCGCLLGFLYHNRSPAKIFMGDTGSMFLGFIIAMFSVKFLSLYNNIPAISAGRQAAAIPLLVSLLVIPLSDTIIVFTKRLLAKKSPFIADRTHIHHRLIDLRLSHMQATAILVLVNAGCFLFVSGTPFLQAGWQLTGIVLYVALFNIAVYYIKILQAKQPPTHLQNSTVSEIEKSPLKIIFKNVESKEEVEVY